MRMVQVCKHRLWLHCGHHCTHNPISDNTSPQKSKVMTHSPKKLASFRFASSLSTLALFGVVMSVMSQGTLTAIPKDTSGEAIGEASEKTWSNCGERAHATVCLSSQCPKLPVKHAPPLNPALAFTATADSAWDKPFEGLLAL